MNDFHSAEQPPDASATGGIVHLLSEERFNWRSNGASVVLHIVAITVAATISLAPEAIQRPRSRASVQIVAPVVEKPLPPKRIVRLPPPAQLRSLLPAPAPPAPPKIELPPPPVVKPAAPTPAPQLAVATPKPPPPPPTPVPAAPTPRPVHVGVLDTPRQTPAETRPRAEIQVGVLESKPQLLASATRPRSEVQTGAFSSPDGIAAERAPTARPNVAKVGVFGEPAKTANRPANGAPIRVADAGFSRATVSPTTATPPAAVRQSGFADAQPLQQETRKPAQPPPQAPLEPLEILSKPRPVYTEEAREKKIEGEVAVEAVFSAAGQVRALRVVRPLGHGLDAEAIRAAEAIRFKPARRNGVPVDQTAVVRIVFQLAY
ncbi:MAG: TonB family protein [Bryobacterales bacterium]|nr:TonB family protein [Bryobacterales bacterium]